MPSDAAGVDWKDKLNGKRKKWSGVNGQLEWEKKKNGVDGGMIGMGKEVMEGSGRKIGRGK